MKFKIGDKVKILPSATEIGVEEEEVGKVGIISHASSDTNIMVQMNETCKVRGYIPEWSVEASMIKLFFTKGEQLLFSFMN